MNWEKSLQETTFEIDRSPSMSNVTVDATVVNAVEDVGTQRAQYLLTYVLIMFVVLFLVFQRATLQVAVCVRAARHLHEKLFRGIIRTRMMFFNMNSSGRIINRFSKEIGTIDSTLLISLYDSVYVNS